VLSNRGTTNGSGCFRDGDASALTSCCQNITFLGYWIEFVLKLAKGHYGTTFSVPTKRTSIVHSKAQLKTLLSNSISDTSLDHTAIAPASIS
jgi:hypothetical protein